MRRPLDAARSTDVGVLTGVLFHVRALDVHAHDLAVVKFDVDVAVVGDRFVVLRGLEVLREVRVEVLLTREPAVLGNRAVQCETDLDRVFHRFLIDDRERARKAERDRGDGRVGFGGENIGRAVEHFGCRAELDVDLDAEDRVVLLDRLVVVERLDVGVGVHLAPPSRAVALFRIGPPQDSSSSASSAPPAR